MVSGTGLKSGMRLRALGPPEDNMHSAPSSHTGGSQPSIAPVSEDLTLLASMGTGHTCSALTHMQATHPHKSK